MLEPRSGRPWCGAARCGSSPVRHEAPRRPRPPRDRREGSASVSCARVRSSSRRSALGLLLDRWRCDRRPRSPARARRPAAAPRAVRARLQGLELRLEGPELALRAERALLELGIGRDRGSRASSRKSCSSSSALRYWSWSSPSRSSAAVARSSALRRASPSSRSPGCGEAARTGRSCAGRGSSAVRSGVFATTERSRATPNTARPSTTSIANKNSAFVFHGPGAVAMGVSGRVNSTTAGLPTPERNRRGSMIDTFALEGRDHVGCPSARP